MHPIAIALHVRVLSDLPIKFYMQASVSKSGLASNS